MSTLLKAHLLKTDNPFIMLKCYLEEILKEQGITWENLIDAIERESKKSKALYSRLPISPKTVEILKDILEKYPVGNFREKTDTTEGIKPPKLSGRKYEKFEDSDGKLRTKTVTGNDPMHPEVMEQNIRTLISALEKSPAYEKEATVLKPIIDNLRAMLLEKQTVPKQKVPVKDIDTGKIKGKTHKQLLEDGLKLLENIETFAIEITEDDIVDLEGETIYGPKIEKAVNSLMKNPKSYINLMKHVENKEVEKIKEMYNLSNDDLESIKNVRDEKHIEVIETLQLSKEEQRYFRERLGLLEKINDKLNQEIEYETFEDSKLVKVKEPLHEIISNVYQYSNTVKIVKDIAEHRNINDRLKDLYKEYIKGGTLYTIPNLLNNPDIKNRMRADLTVSDIMQRLEEGENVTWEVN
ncbi:MAG: hypothetical protein GOVbin556_71 [Prokaryotic dsDNA virus sp.]|nr:MAG: hypothetical protein GOVbin556_71 [Prokaryotic dsDNA virus sp.]